MFEEIRRWRERLVSEPNAKAAMNQKKPRRFPQAEYVGLDFHKETISYCVKDGSSRNRAARAIPAKRLDRDMWMNKLPQPWTAAMEATIPYLTETTRNQFG